MATITPTPPKTRRRGPFPAGRECATPGCGTLLHQWHEGPHCYVHELAEELSEFEHRRALADFTAEPPDQAA